MSRLGNLSAASRERIRLAHAMLASAYAGVDDEASLDYAANGSTDPSIKAAYFYLQGIAEAYDVPIDALFEATLHWYTVIGFAHEDERACWHVRARTPAEAEKRAFSVENGPMRVAGVIVGKHNAVDSGEPLTNEGLSTTKPEEYKNPLLCPRGCGAKSDVQGEAIWTATTTDPNAFGASDTDNPTAPRSIQLDEWCCHTCGAHFWT